MDSDDLIGLQIRLEYQLDEAGTIVPIPGSSEQAFYLVYQHSLGYQAYFNQAIPISLRKNLLAVGPSAAFEHPEVVINLIGEGFRPGKGGAEVYWSGYFASQLDPGDFPLPIAVDGSWVVIQGGQTVCRAMSVRQDARCAEVYVETLPAYRRRGYGRQAVAAWANDILESGRVPLYSYKMRNSASAALAQSVGATWYANVVEFDPCDAYE